jgi:hypothetical protein
MRTAHQSLYTVEEFISLSVIDYMMLVELLTKKNVNPLLLCEAKNIGFTLEVI